MEMAHPQDERSKDRWVLKFQKIQLNWIWGPSVMHKKCLPEGCVSTQKKTKLCAKVHHGLPTPVLSGKKIVGGIERNQHPTLMSQSLTVQATLAELHNNGFFKLKDISMDRGTILQQSSQIEAGNIGLSGALTEEWNAYILQPKGGFSEHFDRMVS